MRIIFYKNLSNLFFLTLFFSLIISQQALAKESLLINQGDLIYDLQLVNPMLLAEEVQNLQVNLVNRQLKLNEIVVNKKMSTGDVLISLIIPGGMIYGSYKLYEQENAKKSLLTTSDDINDLSLDLIELSSEISNHSKIQVASTGYNEQFNL